jgi:endo-1,3(4)-beta-glucanase
LPGKLKLRLGSTYTPIKPGADLPNRDIINPSSDDPFFPITRCLDWFAGHSWASGIANGAGSRDQESVGEAVNGYYGAMLWATVALDQEHANFARLLLAIEQQAAKTYWHLYPSAGKDDPMNPYPEAKFRDLITVGNVMDWQTGAWLFWGAEKVQIAAIQILPVTPVNEVRVL